MVNEADVDPPAIVIVAGADADASLVDKATDAPPGGAAAFRVTLPVAETPPTTVVGATVTVDICSGDTVKATDFV